MKVLHAGLVILASVLLAGCAKSWEADYSTLDLVDVSGRVTLDGVPLADASVIFENPDATYSYGKTDADGNYSLMFNSEKSGATRGPKVVRIRSSGGGEGEEAPSEGEDGKITQAKDAIHEAYNSQSKLRAAVDGKSQVLNFELKSDGSVTRPSG